VNCTAPTLSQKGPGGPPVKGDPTINDNGSEFRVCILGPPVNLRRMNHSFRQFPGSILEGHDGGIQFTIEIAIPEVKKKFK
jgi:hypothetical protein